MAAGEYAQYRHEGHRRGAVVQQTLRLDQHPKAALCIGFLERRNDRYRIGRGNQRPEDDCATPVPGQRKVHTKGCDGGREHDTHACEKRHDGQLLLELSPVDEERGLEHQGRQKNIKDQILRQVPFDGEMTEMKGHPREHEAHGIGQMHATRQHGHQRRHEEKKAELR